MLPVFQGETRTAKETKLCQGFDEIKEKRKLDERIGREA